MENKVILGEKVFLTQITIDDCEDFIRWRNSDFIRSYFIYRQDITLEEQQIWVRDKVDTGIVAQFVIWDRVDNKKIGCTYLQKIDKEKKEAEFGIFIGEQEYIGCGRGAEAAKKMIEFGFEKLGLERIYLRALKENTRAIKSYQKAGFKREGHEELVRIENKDVAVVFMAIKK